MGVTGQSVHIIGCSHGPGIVDIRTEVVGYGTGYPIPAIKFCNHWVFGMQGGSHLLSE